MWLRFKFCHSECGSPLKPGLEQKREVAAGEVAAAEARVAAAKAAVQYEWEAVHESDANLVGIACLILRYKK